MTFSQNGLKQLFAIDGGAHSDVLYSMGEGQVGGYAKTLLLLHFIIVTRKVHSSIQMAITALLHTLRSLPSLPPNS